MITREGQKENSKNAKARLASSRSTEEKHRPSSLVTMDVWNCTHISVKLLSLKKAEKMKLLGYVSHYGTALNCGGDQE